MDSTVAESGKWYDPVRESLASRCWNTLVGVQKTPKPTPKPITNIIATKCKQRSSKQRKLNMVSEAIFDSPVVERMTPPPPPPPTPPPPALPALPVEHSTHFDHCSEDDWEVEPNEFKQRVVCMERLNANKPWIQSQICALHDRRDTLVRDLSTNDTLLCPQGHCSLRQYARVTAFVKNVPVNVPLTSNGVAYSADLLYLMLTLDTDKYLDTRSFFAYISITPEWEVKLFITNSVLFVDIHGDQDGSNARYIDLCYNIIANLVPKAELMCE